MLRCAALAVPIVVGAIAGICVLRSSGHDDHPPRTVQVSSTAPRFTSLRGLVAGSDAVVLAEIVATAEGRTITAPGDVDRGVRTQLSELRVVQTLAGDPMTSLVVEEEAALLDGTPLRVDGTPPLEEGERGVFFLVRGDSGADALYAVVGPQGRYLVGDVGLETAAAGDPLAAAVVEMGGPALIRRIAAMDATATASSGGS